MLAREAFFSAVFEIVMFAYSFHTAVPCRGIAAESSSLQCMYPPHAPGGGGGVRVRPNLPFLTHRRTSRDQSS